MALQTNLRGQGLSKTSPSPGFTDFGARCHRMACLSPKVRLQWLMLVIVLNSKLFLACHSSLPQCKTLQSRILAVPLLVAQILLKPATLCPEWLTCRSRNRRCPSWADLSGRCQAWTSLKLNFRGCLWANLPSPCKFHKFFLKDLCLEVWRSSLQI